MAGSHIDRSGEEEEDSHMKKYLNVGGDSHELGGDPDPDLGSMLWVIMANGFMSRGSHGAPPLKKI